MAQPTINTIRVANPEIEGNAKSYLTSDIDASSTSLSMASSSGFPSSGYFYLLIGVYGDEKAEIVLASSISGTTVTVSGTSHSHSASEPITFIEYNQIVYYGLGTETEVPGSHILKTLDIDPTAQFTEYTDDSGSYDYFVTAYSNEHDTEISGYSEVISSSSFTRRSTERIIKSAALKALTKIDENPGSRLTLDIALTILQDGLDEISVSKKRWPFWNTVATDSTVADTSYTSKPTGLTQLVRIKVKDTTLIWISGATYNLYTDTSTTQKGQPAYYTERDGKYYLYPTPDKAYDVEIEYYKVPDVISNMSTEIDIPLVPILIYYCGAQFAYIRGNDKKGDSLYEMYIRLLEEQKEEYGGPAQDGTPESIEWTSDLNNGNLV